MYLHKTSWSQGQVVSAEIFITSYFNCNYFYTLYNIVCPFVFDFYVLNLISNFPDVEFGLTVIESLLLCLCSLY